MCVTVAVFAWLDARVGGKMVVYSKAIMKSLLSRTTGGWSVYLMMISDVLYLSMGVGKKLRIFVSAPKTEAAG